MNRTLTQRRITKTPKTLKKTMAQLITHTNRNSNNMLNHKPINVFKKLINISILSLVIWSPLSLASDTKQLFEEAIYTEQTSGDLDKAIGIYQQVLDADNSHLIAKALYRQAHCYHLQGNDDAAKKNLNKIVAQYSKSPVMQQAQTLLMTMNASSLKLLPAPWEDGEVLQYMIKLPTGKTVGTIGNSRKKTYIDNKTHWVLDNYIVGNALIHQRVIAEDVSFLPTMSSSQSPQLGQSLSTFAHTNGNTNITTTFPKQKDKEALKLSAQKILLDSAQIIDLARRLPLALGYKTERSLFIGMTNQLAKVYIEVVGQESITQLSQQFDTYKLKISIEIDTIVAKTFEVWLADNQQRYPLKIDEGGIISELSAISTAELNDNPQYSHPKYGFKFNTKKDRQVLDMSFSNDNTGLKLLILTPDLPAKIILTAVPKDNKKKININDSLAMHKKRLKYAEKRHGPDAFRTDTPVVNLRNNEKVHLYAVNYRISKDQSLSSMGATFTYNNHLFTLSTTALTSDHEQVIQEALNMIESIEAI